MSQDVMISRQVWMSCGRVGVDSAGISQKSVVSPPLIKGGLGGICSNNPPLPLPAGEGISRDKRGEAYSFIYILA
jgi:hypothetical protein